MAQNPLVQEESWFHESWKRREDEPWVEKGEEGTGNPWVSCSQATSTAEAPDLQDLKEDTCLAYPARLQGR